MSFDEAPSANAAHWSGKTLPLWAKVRIGRSTSQGVIGAGIILFQISPMGKNEIMIVEDDQDLGRILQLHLKGRGFNTIFVQSISQATGYLAHEHPTLLLFDNHLTDGLALDHIGEIKTSTPDLSIVLMTADFIEELRSHQNYVYLDGLLLKPFAPEILNQVLHHAISNKRY